MKCADKAPEAPLLQTPKGGRLYPVYVDRAVKAALGGVEGISGRKSPHVLRHTLATELLDGGTDKVFINPPIQGQKTTEKLEIKFKALKFEAGEQLVAFAEKKVSRLSRFCEGLTEEVEVALEDHLKQGKLAKIQIHIPGEELIIEREADTFENAITEAVDAMKEKLTRVKEKKFEN